jgi:hypothetical protein
MKDETVARLEAELDRVLTTLVAAANGSRTTLRIDDQARGWNVNFICAEGLKPGIKSLRGDGSIDQRAAATVKWMEAHRKNLVQPDIINNPDPAPPPALMSAYAAKAQMLAPALQPDRIPPRLDFGSLRRRHARVHGCRDRGARSCGHRGQTSHQHLTWQRSCREAR